MLHMAVCRGHWRRVGQRAGARRGMGIWLGQNKCQAAAAKSLLSQQQSKASCQTSGCTARLPVWSFPRPPCALVIWNALHHGTYLALCHQTNGNSWVGKTYLLFSLMAVFPESLLVLCFAPQCCTACGALPWTEHTASLAAADTAPYVHLWSHELH